MNTKYYEEKLVHLANLKAKDFYGDDLPEPIQQRLDAELKFISKHGLSPTYMFAYEAPRHLQKCIIPMTISDYTLVAFLLGLTEVDPLPPHYFCPCCGYIEFPFGCDTEKTEWDLPGKPCPDCLENLHKYGYSVKMTDDTNPNIICDHANKGEKQEIKEFAKKFFDDCKLVYGAALDELSENWEEKIINNAEYEENIIYLLPKEDIQNHSFDKTIADLPVALDIDDSFGVEPLIYFSYFNDSPEYWGRKLKERANCGNLCIYLDDYCALSLFSSPKVLRIGNYYNKSGMLDIPFLMDNTELKNLAEREYKNFTELLCAYESTNPFAKSSDMHSSTNLYIVINALKFAFYKANYPAAYYMTMLDHYKNKITLNALTDDTEDLKDKAIYGNDSFSVFLYEMRRRVKIFPIHKYRSKEYEFSEYRDSTCLHGILPPLSLLPEIKVPVWDDDGFLSGLEYSSEVMTVTGEISDVIYENCKNGYAVFKITEEDGNTLLCKGVMPELNLDDIYTFKGKMREDSKYGDYLEVTEYEKFF